MSSPGQRSPTTSGDDERKPLLREEIETLCILHAVGLTGCPMADLAERLGLSPALAQAIIDSIEPLVAIGCLERSDDRIAVTAPGQDWLMDRLRELRVA